MAGMPGRSGGYRPGAGRKPKPVAPLEAEVTDDPLHFLLAVMNDSAADPKLRVRAAVAAAQYVHTRTKDGGKKEAKQDAAQDAAAGKFQPAAPPRLVSSRG